MGILNKTGEAIEGAARQLTVHAERVADHLAGTGTGNANAAGLQSMSSGAMQGFGSDCPPPRPEAPSGPYPHLSVSSNAVRRSYHEDEPLPVTAASRPGLTVDASADAGGVPSQMRSPIGRQKASDSALSPEK